MIEIVKRGLICERVKQFETVILELICSEITTSTNGFVWASIGHPTLIIWSRLSKRLVIPAKM